MSNETANMDFKYVLQDFNNVYIGARLTFAELCEQDDTPQRLRTAVFQYVIPEVGEEIRICDALSSMTKDSKLAMVLKQLRCKIKTVKPKIKVDKKVFKIADKLGKEEILCQLSEECAELIQSCLKYRRTTKGLTPKSEEEVRENLFEELSDVLMNIEQIKYLFDKELSDTTVENVIEKWHSYKADRWYRRTFVSQEEN